jgi:hypothetical protein
MESAGQPGAEGNLQGAEDASTDSDKDISPRFPDRFSAEESEVGTAAAQVCGSDAGTFLKSSTVCHIKLI